MSVCKVPAIVVIQTVLLQLLPVRKAISGADENIDQASQPTKLILRECHLYKTSSEIKEKLRNVPSDSTGNHLP